MLHTFKQYWPAWLLTLLGVVLTFIDIPHIGAIALVLVSLIWTLSVAKVARESGAPTPAVVQAPAPMEASQSANFDATVIDDSLQVIMNDIDAVVDQEVEVIRGELLQVKELVAEAIETLNSSFMGLHNQTQEEYKMVVSLLDNLGAVVKA